MYRANFNIGRYYLYKITCLSNSNFSYLDTMKNDIPKANPNESTI